MRNGGPLIEELRPVPHCQKKFPIPMGAWDGPERQDWKLRRQTVTCHIGRQLDDTTFQRHLAQRKAAMTALPRKPISASPQSPVSPSLQALHGSCGWSALFPLEGCWCCKTRQSAKERTSHGCAQRTKLGLRLFFFSGRPWFVAAPFT